MTTTGASSSGSKPSKPRPWKKGPIGLGLVAAGIAIGVLAVEVAWTAPVRLSVRAYNELIAAANAQDRGAIEALCSDRYLRDRGVAFAPEGGMIGLPRTIHKNFQAWRKGPNVWICPTNRVGPVFQFIREGRVWKFDGTIGLLRAGGVVDTDMELDPGSAPNPGPAGE